MAEGIGWQSLAALDWLRPLWILVPLLLALVGRNATVGWLGARLPAHLAAALRLTVGDSRAARLDRWLRWLLVALLSAALAGPALRLDPLDASLADTRLTVVVDLSAAALQADLAPSRLERGRYLMEALWARADAVASELWAVAGSAHRALPVSRDSAISALYLRELTPQRMPQPGRDLTALEPLWATPPATVVLLTGVLSGADRRQLADWRAAGSAVHLVWLNSQPLADPPAGVALYAGDQTRQSVDELHSRLMAEQWRRQPGERRHYTDFSPWLAAAALWLVLLRGALQGGWLRRGWLPVVACALLLAALLPGHSHAEPLEAGAQPWRDRLLGQLLTADQRGRWWYERGDYRRAASHFVDPAWAAVAHYRAGDFDAARTQFASLNSAHGWYNAALAAAAQRRYDYALNDVGRALAAQPEWPAAVALRDQLRALLAAMAEQAAEQQTEQWQSDSQPLAVDDDELPATSTGELAEQGGGAQLSAEQLTDEALRAAWLKQVSHGPGEFLARKFSRQWRASRAQRDDD